MSIDEIYNKEYWDGKGLQVKTISDVFLPLFYIYISGGIKHNRRVFDFGCGLGRHIDTLVRFGIDAYGYEPSTYAREHPYGKAVGRIFNFVPSQFFDMIICSDVFEHITDGEILAHIKEFKKRSPKLMTKITDKDVAGYSVDKTHINPKSKEEWVEFLKDHYEYIMPISLEHDFYILCTNIPLEAKF